MHFDMEYLLFLQGLREVAPEWLNAMLEFISELAIGPLSLAFPSLIFWCISRDAGAYLFTTRSIARGIMSILKDTACIYRPWIRDPRVQSSLMSTATGYSFPSGHATTATAIYGGTGLTLKRKTGNTLWFILLLIPALITCFTRNWVGAHTPQDVAVGFILSICVIFLNERLMNWLAEHPEKDSLVTLLVFAISAVALAYVTFKPYPVDYAADGSILVDPSKMMQDAYGDIGLVSGTFLFWLLERRLIHFSTDRLPIPVRILRAAAGIAVVWILYTFLQPALKAAVTQPHARKFLLSVLNTFVLLFLYPAVFTFAERLFGRK